MKPSNELELSVTKDGQEMIKKARQDGVETVWDRYDAQSNIVLIAKQA